MSICSLRKRPFVTIVAEKPAETASPAPGQAFQRARGIGGVASLQRDGAGYVAEVLRHAGAPSALAGYWAVTEDGHVSQVRAGENLGATLHHDAVVRELLAVPTLAATVRFMPASAPGSPRRHVVFVVTEAASGRPLQALSLLNNPFIDQCAASFADRITSAAGDDAEQQVMQLYQFAFSRGPTGEEGKLALDFLHEFGLKELCLAMFNTNEFLFVD